jgi:hypothetical protein
MRKHRRNYTTALSFFRGFVDSLGDGGQDLAAHLEAGNPRHTLEGARVATVISIGVDCRSVLVT